MKKVSAVGAEIKLTNKNSNGDTSKITVMVNDIR